MRPILPPLGPYDTHLSPSDIVGHLFATTSTWIDLCSPDATVAHVSRQVFNQEIAFAAFCGLTNVIVEGPKISANHESNSGLVQFARAIKEALNIGPYLQIMVLIPMVHSTMGPVDDSHSLSNLGSPDLGASSPSEATKMDPFDFWDAWNYIRSLCKYNGRLSVGKKSYLQCQSS